MFACTREKGGLTRQGVIERVISRVRRYHFVLRSTPCSSTENEGLRTVAFDVDEQSNAA